jgi:transposase-like protein
MNKSTTAYVKRTQKDYSMSFKLQIVQQIENGELTATQAVKQYGIQARSTVTTWMRKYGNFDWHNKTPYSMSRQKTPQHRLLELEAENLLLKKQNQSLESRAVQSDKKAIIFDMMIDLAEREYNIPIRKNSSPE